MDWLESPNTHIFKINVPGFNKEDIKIIFKVHNSKKHSENSKESSVRKMGKFIKKYGHCTLRVLNGKSFIRITTRPINKTMMWFASLPQPSQESSPHADPQASSSAVPNDTIQDSQDLYDFTGDAREQNRRY